MLVQLDENADKEHLESFSHGIYAAQHLVEHAKYEDEESRIQNSMGPLFHSSKPYLVACTWTGLGHTTWIRNRSGEAIITLSERPTRLKATALYNAVLCGFSGLPNYLIITHGKDVNAMCGNHGTSLHVASYKGHLILQVYYFLMGST